MLRVENDSEGLVVALGYLRHLLVITSIAAAALLSSGTLVAQAQTYPFKPIRLVVQAPPGGGEDFFARILGKHLSQSWSQAVVVDNRPGAGGTLGTEMAARATPDGYTLLMVSSRNAIAPSLYQHLTYDTINDFVATSMLATSVNILVIYSGLSARNVSELIALARQRPGKLVLASAGVGSMSHIAGQLFSSMARINVIHVPYKGSGPAEVDLASGQVSFMVDSLPAALPNVQAGRIRALATTGNKRFGGLPDVPTVAEAGLPGYESRQWWGILAPAGTPRSVVNKLSREIIRVMALPEVKEMVRRQGAESQTSQSPQEFMNYLRSEVARYSKIMADAGIKGE